MSEQRMRPRVVIADDSPIMAVRLSAALATQCTVDAVVENGVKLTEAACRHKPDVIVSDIQMPIMTGIEAAQIILERKPNTRFVFVTATPDRDILRHVLEMGAFGYVLKNDVTLELAAAVVAAMENRQYLSHNVYVLLGNNPADGPQD